MAEWEQIARKHFEEQKKKIPSDWFLDNDKLEQLRGAGTAQEGRLIDLQAAKKSGILESNEINITENYTARELLGHLRQGTLSAERIATAYCKRAAVAQQLPLTLSPATKNSPIDIIQDSLHVDGHFASVGYVAFLKQDRPKGNAALVKLLLDAGAVLYCKTNIPQTMMTCDSENNIFGRTLNPHNTRLTAGGSSGGEGALVAFRGSPLGIGSDLAGSVRIPAFCCGVYGFKPTVDRIPFAGQSLSPWPMIP
ncbi:amidase [Colletotrichum cuscutae]|uniref:amidase n=1 Tax=Colletotrichum cuscutae TaxID=1209917 RepID=A0AAI9VH49_9PEZI|nr:amidase [Colletotrichum cuscutae]